MLGVLVKKLKIVSKTGRKTLSDLLINVILLCNIVASFLGGVSLPAGFVHNCLLAISISVGIQLVSVYGSKLLLRRYPRKRKAYCQFALTPALQDCLLPISMLVDKYGGDAAFASQITFASTLCSVPLLTVIME